MKNQLRILLVEDMPQDAELIERELAKAGLQARARRVETEAQFLHELERHPPDVILSDHGLPAFDGFTALAAARERCPGIPFIFVTAAHGDETAVDILKRGADDYVFKEKLHLLAPAIQRALRASAQRARPQRQKPSAEEGPARADHTPHRHAVQLEADYRELQELSYTLARELRTPLRNIDSFVELLLKLASDKLDSKSKSCLKTISDSARQIARLSDELLSFTRIGRAEMYRLQFSLTEVAHEIIHELRRETEGRQVDWIVGPLPEIVGDPPLLLQALTELLANALKFTRPRHSARIEIGAAPAEKEAVIFVADNGVGFDPHYRDKLFGIFQRLHPAGEFEGLGVGLAKVRRIIQQHGGRAWAEGFPDKGATFYFSLPLARNTPQVESAEE